MPRSYLENMSLEIENSSLILKVDKEDTVYLDSEIFNVCGHLFRNLVLYIDKNFMTSMLTTSVLYFVVTGIQYWTSDYMIYYLKIDTLQV